MDAVHRHGVILRTERDAALHAPIPPADARARRFREQLALPLDRPVVLSGHQCEFWHAGILAKWFAVEALSAQLGATRAWIHVDQDANDAGSVRYPTADLRVREWRWTPRSSGVPVALRPSARVPATPNDAHPTIKDALGALRRAIVTHERVASLADQIALSLRDLLAPCAQAATTELRATTLAHTDLFAEWVEWMRQNPVACVEAYNRAARAHPAAHVRPLEPGELPLWHIEPGQERRRVSAARLESLDVRSLAPRALFMTALLRSAGCDVFVHGTGGEKYELVTRDWIRAWRGAEEAARLAPAIIASATLTLALSAEATPTPEQIARARWLARSARTSPALIGDMESQREVMELVARMRRDRKERSRAYESLHETLRRWRERHGAALQELERRAEQLRGQLRTSSVVHERAWAFVFHPPDTLRDLRRVIIDRVPELLTR